MFYTLQFANYFHFFSLSPTDFGALLTTRTSFFLKREEIKTPYATNNPLNIIATGRFTFHKKNLYFSFYISERALRPRAIQFIDETGHILEEIILVQSNNMFSVYQNSTGKLCGVWRRKHQQMSLCFIATFNALLFFSSI